MDIQLPVMTMYESRYPCSALPFSRNNEEMDPDMSHEADRIQETLKQLTQCRYSP